MQNATNGIKQFDATDAASRTNFNTALQSVDTKFDGSNGHTHDGTAGNGPKIGTAGLSDGAVTPAKLSFNPSTQWYAAASGSANSYTVTLSNPTPSALTEGMAVAVKINLANTGASTINVNGLGAKAIKKANGNDVTSGNLKAGSIYTLRYDGSANFILQGEGGEYGTATAPQVLSGYTIGTDSGIVSGTMANQVGAVVDSDGGKITAMSVDTTNVMTTIRFKPNLNGYYDDTTRFGIQVGSLLPSNIKAGVTVGTSVTGTFTSDATAPATCILNGQTAYVNGNKITGTMPDYQNSWGLTSQIIANEGRIHLLPPKGYYDPAIAGTGTYYNDANFSAANIRSGTTMLGLTGTLQPGYAASGTATTSSGAVTVTGLAFKPKAVIMRGSLSSGSHGYLSEYIESAGNFCTLMHISATGWSGSSTDIQNIAVDGSTYYVVNGGFKLPSNIVGTVYWYAFG